MSSHVYYYMSILQFILEVRITWNTSYSQWKCCTHLKQRLWTQVIQTSFQSSQEFFFLFILLYFSCKFSIWIHVNSYEQFFMTALCVRLYQWARASRGRRRKAWSSSSPADGGSVQLSVCPASWSQPWSPTSLWGLAGGRGLSMCPADSPHSLQQPHTVTLKHPRAWYTVVKSVRKRTCLFLYVRAEFHSWQTKGSK